MLPLLLASSSVYRRELLSRLHLPFICSSPDIDESHRANESAIELVKRLAEEKARALAGSHPGHLIIGLIRLPHSKAGSSASPTRSKTLASNCLPPAASTSAS